MNLKLTINQQYFGIHMQQHNSVTIGDVDQATRAAKWCKRNRINYNMEYSGWPSKTIYKFCFTDEKHLMLFALKWK